MPTKPVCFVGFFGLNRSLRWTGRSIHRNVLDPLRDYGFNLRLAAHFNVPATIQSLRSRETSVAPAMWPTDLPLEACWAEPQNDETLERYTELVASPSFGGGSAEARQTKRNLALQLHSLARLWDLCRYIGARDSDLFVLLRPDLEYIDPVDTREIHSQVFDKGVDLITPNWHQWGGLNDRFAFCSARGAASYCERVHRASGYLAKTGGLHAETFLKSVAVEDGLRLGTIDARAMRVRADGKTWREGFRLPPFLNLVSATRVYRNNLSSSTLGKLLAKVLPNHGT